MVLLTLSSKLFYKSLTRNFFPSVHQADIYLHDFVTQPADRVHPRILIFPRPLTRKGFFTRQGKTLLKRLCSSNPPGKDDNQALEVVLRFYNALKSRNLQELSFMIAEECHCARNFVPFMKSFQGKKVLAFFYYLIRTLGNNIEIVVQPTIQDGMKIRIEWKLEWNKTHMPLGEGFSIHICQIYQGKVIIRNVEMFMKPLLDLQPVILKILASKVVEKISSGKTFPELKDKRALHMLIALLLIVALLFFLKIKWH